MYKKSQKLRELRKVMESGIQEEYQACIGIVSQKQLNVWSKIDPRVGRYRKALSAKCGHKRDLMVVDSLFKQAMAGNPTCIAIYLKFKMGWKDSPQMESHISNVVVNYKELSASDIRTQHRIASEPK